MEKERIAKQERLKRERIEAQQRLARERRKRKEQDRQILDKEYQESLARGYARQAGEQVMAAIGGGRDLRTKVQSWRYDKFSKEFEIDLAIYFNGAFNRNNNYVVEGSLTVGVNGNNPKFARSYVNDKFKDLEKTITIFKIIGGTERR
ncbi:MAG: hypothetical protein LBC74_11150 [Planctomycetaceae bacterium]|nr:hypothetical protein [Planctomycetaceae bacterium]